MTPHRHPGRLFIVSAPSGAGKTTLCRALLDRFSDICYSVSFTTRSPRPGEIEGVDYRFISAAAFRRGIEQNRWAEWAKVHGHYYGTDALLLSDATGRGMDVLLDIDVQGTCQLLKRFPDAVTVFIMPPSVDALRVRLQRRGADGEAVIARRMAAAEKEIRCRNRYRHVVVNDRVERAAAELAELVRGYRRGGGARATDES